MFNVWIRGRRVIIKRERDREREKERERGGEKNMHKEDGQRESITEMLIYLIL